MNRALIVMVKKPVTGGAKTRLIPYFSAEMAAELYGCFIRDVTELTRALPSVTLFMAYWPPSAETYFRRLAPGFGLILQQGATLGERLDNAMTRCLEMGSSQVVALASDSPNLPPAYLSQAFAGLDENGVDLVLGPCDDGGYYLIGWKRRIPSLVRDVKMSTPYVLSDTLAMAASEELKVWLLPSWYDVDTPDDLARLAADLSRNRSGAEHTRHFLETRMPAR